MRWFASTAVTSSLVLATCAHVWAGSAADAANVSASGHAATLNTQSEGSAAGTKNYYDHIKPNYGSGAALNENGLKPITQAAPLKNVAGTKTLGGVAFLQSADKPLLRVTMIPNFATGDIAAIAIEQDLNATGVIDYTSSIGGGGMMISGACSNGVILCSPGTYTNCIYERWDSDANGGITTSSRLGTPTSKNDLFNCYCFSNYCSRFNNSSTLNLGRIDQEISGSLLATFMEKRPDLIVSSVTSTDSIVSYYGTKSASISSVPGYTAPKKANKDYSDLPVLTGNTPDVTFGYYDNSGALDAAAVTENQSMAAIPNSLYNIVNNLQKNAGSSVSTCTNQRELTLYNKTVYNTGTLSTTALQTAHQVFARMNFDGSTNFSAEVGGSITNVSGLNPGTIINLGSIPLAKGSNSLNYQTTLANFNCQYQCNSNCQGLPQNGSIGLSWIPGYPAQSAWNEGGGYMVQSGVQGVTVTCSLTAEASEEGVNESIINGCSSFESDNSCKLQDEKWDNRPYIVNFLATGFQMAQVCNDYPGVLRNYRVCKPWMKQKRTYVCDKNNGNNFDAFLTQLRTQVKATTDAAVLPAGAGTSPTCEVACKTKIARKDTQVRYSGSESDVKQSASVALNAFDYFVKACTVTNGANVCPLDATKGEAIVKDCGCLNEFAEALAQADAINRAANDTTCSSVQKQ